MADRHLRSISIQTSCRLHVGLLGGTDGPRRFGGAGLMVRDPSIRVVARLAPELKAPAVHGEIDPELTERARALVDRLSGELELPPIVVDLQTTARLHGGMGTGTQFAVAITAACCRLAGLTFTPEELARRSGRGRRSAIGVHGFFRGGFLVDGGFRQRDLSDEPVERGKSLAPLVASVAFPEDWPIVLITAPAERGTHGASEEHAIARCLAIPLSVTEHLSRLLLLGMLPGLAERDYRTFAEALTEYNQQVGECFSPVQGGTYASPAIAERAAALREAGALAVGQSSWGPTVFAVFPSPEALDSARPLLQRQVAKWQGAELIETRAATGGATLVEQ